MAFDESLAARIRTALAWKNGVGGLGYLLNGNMLVGVWENSMIARLGPDEGEEALLEPHFDTPRSPILTHARWVPCIAGGKKSLQPSSLRL